MIKKNDKDYQLFSRRAFLLGAIQGGVLLGLTGRMAWLQVVHGEKYKTLADRNRINVRLLPPERGVIIDRYGTPLATNDQNFRVVLIPEQAKDIKLALGALNDLIDITDYQMKNALDLAKKQPAYLPIEIRDNLNWEEVSKIEVNIPDLPGLSTDVGTRRSYPLEQASAHLVGYVSAPDKDDLKKNNMLSLPGFKVGKSGIEKSYDDELRGTAGKTEVEVNVAGREVRELSRIEPVQGKSVVLSIDSELQRLTQDRLLKERSASAVIMDAHTGAVYSLASGPSFDPNVFTRGISHPELETLLSDPTNPLTNKAVGGQYPPGSTFKMIVALAALKHGVINRHTTFNCSGQFRFGRGKFHCWRDEGHGDMDLAQAIAQSCDVYFYNIATKVGIDNIAEMARRFGLGERLGIEIPYERPGTLPDREWKLGYIGKPWQPGETIVASIGQGYVQSTPLQLAVMTARMVNGGKAVKPWLTAGIDDHIINREEPGPIGVNARHLDMVKKAMDLVTMGDMGTARGSRIRKDGLEMGGKTGTSQVRRITQKERDEGIKNENLEWKFRHHALFVGYAPIQSPRYIASVVVEHGVSGSRAAAPIAKELLLATQRRDPANKSLILDEDKLMKYLTGLSHSKKSTEGDKR